MYALLRRFLFSLPPETAHSVGMAGLAFSPAAHALMALERPRRNVERLEVRKKSMGDLVFRSPVGIAGGFDKNAEVAAGLAAVGFGFLELGTVTARAQPANPAPNLFRLPADRALVNRLGFPNQGAETIARRYRHRRYGTPRIPIGFSIGKSREVPLDPLAEALDDYERSFRAVQPVSQFVVVNVSSPNTKGLRALQSGDVARQLFARLQKVNRELGAKPLLVKVAPDLADEDYESFLTAVRDEGLAGVIATNTTIKREGLGLQTSRDEIARIGDGGLSGPPLATRSRAMVRRARERLGDEATVIGVGGIETTDDVLAMLHAGADLVQMYTGFVYGGPGLPWKMARELLQRMDAAGVTSIRDLLAQSAATPYR